MEITLEYNVDCTSQRMVIVMGEISICLKGEVGQFSSLLSGTVEWWGLAQLGWARTWCYFSSTVESEI
jgi:hypothetical protein